MSLYRLSFVCILLAVVLASVVSADVRRPNIVLFLADDLGYGEIQHLNPTRGKIATPCLNALARRGMVFTNAHSGSAVCTPTRYGLMTGRYAWRTRLQRGVLTGGRSLIDRDRLTLAKMLKDCGYHTAVIGKWHLGMLFDGGKNPSADVSLNATVTDGPLSHGGFDEFYGFHHARQMNLWIENDQVVEHIDAVEMLPRLTQEAVDYIERRSIEQRSDRPAPFFLYVPWNAPHSPVAPSPQWQGRSGLNAHADYVMQTDASCGLVIDALRRWDLFENTIVIFTSDNGTSARTAQVEALVRMGHYPSADRRGYKADAWDGGHRVPLIVSWPGVVAGDSICDDLICLNDVMPTLAEVVGYDLPAEAAVDGFSFYPSLQQDGNSSRKDVIHHSIRGHFAIRQGKWKLLLCPGSGGWSDPRPTKANWEQAAQQGTPLVQLYDMQNDPEEQRNLASQMPKKVAELRTLLEGQVAAGRTNAGPPQQNAGPVDLWKDPRQERVSNDRRS